jgi:hypothetical protein
MSGKTPRTTDARKIDRDLKDIHPPVEKAIIWIWICGV